MMKLITFIKAKSWKLLNIALSAVMPFRINDVFHHRIGLEAINYSLALQMCG